MMGLFSFIGGVTMFNKAVHALFDGPEDNVMYNTDAKVCKCYWSSVSGNRLRCNHPAQFTAKYCCDLPEVGVEEPVPCMFWVPRNMNDDVKGFVGPRGRRN